MTTLKLKESNNKMKITNDCMACGQCMEYCPNEAIAVIILHGGRYGQCFILQDKCTNCGTCLEEVDCPGEAIVR